MTFQSGKSGNPNGRPKGTGTRQQVFSTLVEPHQEALFKVAIDMALKALQAVTSGAITPSEAGEVASLIGANARLIALVELNQRMNAFADKEA